MFLAEVYLLHRRNLFAHSLSQVFVGDLAIPILIKPLVKCLHLLRLCVKAPICDQLIEAVSLNEVAASMLPFYECLFDGFVLVECSRYEPFA